MAKRGATLERIHRVRTLQLGLKRAEEARANEKLASEGALRQRIAQLADNVAPAETNAHAFSLIAAAHFRERLHQSAVAADYRLQLAEQRLHQASEEARDAKRDQTAVEKLMAREQALEVAKAMRALEETPPLRKIRHDPC